MSLRLVYSPNKKFPKGMWLSVGEGKNRRHRKKIMNGRIFRSVDHPIDPWPVADLFASRMDWDYCCSVV
jgi:hypothetical protein